MINCALIGVGNFGSKILKNLKKHNVNIIQLCDSNIVIQNRYKNQFNISSDYNAALKNNLIDSVFIASPSSTHYRIITDALIANKHVFCEKPICSSYNELLNIYKLNSHHKKYLYCDYTFLHTNIIKELRKYLHNPHCIDYTHINISWFNNNLHTTDVTQNKNTYIDVIRDLFVHCVSILIDIYNTNDISIINVDNIYSNNHIIESKIYASISDKLCVITVSWNHTVKQRIILFSNQTNCLRVDLIENRIDIIDNKYKTHKHILVQESTEPLYTSISSFISICLIFRL
jgi:predicted dehydrogenase